MAFLFGKNKNKSPGDLVKATKEGLLQLEKNKANPKNNEKVLEELSKNVAMMKVVLYGDQEHEPNQDLAVSLANEIYSNDLLPVLVGEIAKLEFETKKDVGLIFNNLVRKQIGGKLATVDYISKNPAVLNTLVEGYANGDIALNTGPMLRECLKHEPLSKYVLYSPIFLKFFEFVEVSNFDVASDAFSTFKDLLTVHKTIAAEFLENNYDQIFERYRNLLNSKNYVTRRQSLKLLGELLLDRSNFNIMTKYISDVQNLKMMMMLLRDNSKSIQFEAFHVFKVFVANPNKPRPILEILCKNKERLIAFLQNFQNDKEDDQFKDEKAFLLKQIMSLEM